MNHQTLEKRYSGDTWREPLPEHAAIAFKRFGAHMDQQVCVQEMLADEIQQSKGQDQRRQRAEREDCGEENQHVGVLHAIFMWIGKLICFPVLQWSHCFPPEQHRLEPLWKSQDLLCCVVYV